MVTGQALVFMIILQAALAMEVYVSEKATEIDRISTLSSMEIVSENAMLDLCLRLRSWASDGEETTVARLLPLVSDWEAEVERHLNTSGSWCDLSLESLILEPIGNQTLDPTQCGFLGTRGDERIFISALLVVSMGTGDLRMVKAYTIGIAS